MTNFKSIWSIPLLTVCALTLSACSDDETKGESDEIQKVENTGLIEAVTGKVPGIGLTTNEDGTVPLTEDNLRKMAAVTELDLSECELTDLSGIEYFTGLVTLDCSGNKLTSLDFSASSATATKAANSAVTALEDLDCGQNRLTSFTVAGLSKLSRLDCADNRLTSVSVSNLPALENLKLEYNQLTAIDVSTVPSVHYLGCYGNRLTSLDVSKLTRLEALYCYENFLSSLDISMLSADLTLSCGNQQTASGGTQTLTLYLNAAQKAQWEASWSQSPNNQGVEASVK